MFLSTYIVFYYFNNASKTKVILPHIINLHNFWYIFLRFKKKMKIRLTDVYT